MYPKAHILMLVIPQNGKHDTEGITNAIVAAAEAQGARTFRNPFPNDPDPDVELSEITLSDDDERCLQRFSVFTQVTGRPYLCLVKTDQDKT